MQQGLCPNPWISVTLPASKRRRDALQRLGAGFALLLDVLRSTLRVLGERPDADKFALACFDVLALEEVPHGATQDTYLTVAFEVCEVGPLAGEGRARRQISVRSISENSVSGDLAGIGGQLCRLNMSVAAVISNIPD